MYMRGRAVKWRRERDREGEREGGKEEGWTGILELKGFTVVDLHGQRGRKGETN